MKVSLVIASEPHEGKIVPVTDATFLIGRNTECNLRPASPVISKRHCGILVRDGKVAVVDYGSTNGTLVNDVLVMNREVEVEDGTVVMVAPLGPLEFRIVIERDVELESGTPFPRAGSEAHAAEAPVVPMALKVEEEPFLKAAQPSPKVPASNSGEEDPESIAALLLRSDPGQELAEGGTFRILGASASDEDNESIAAAILLDGSSASKDNNPKKPTTPEEMSNVANDLLQKMRRSSKPRSSCRFLS